MKNTFLTLAFTALYAIITTGASAQQAMANDDGILFMEEEKVTYSVPGINAENAALPAGIELQAVQNFRKMYPKVYNPVWFKAIDGGYIASFKDNSTQTSVAYNKKGKWHHTISNYKENNLPETLWENVKNAYGTYEILKVSEVHFDNEIVYMILIQNKHYVKMLRIHNGDMEEVEHYKRLN